MKRRILIPALVIAVAAVGAFAFPEDSGRLNHVSAENTPLVPGVASTSDAITLAQTQDGRPLLVTGLTDGVVTAVDLSRYGAASGADLFDVFAALDREQLVALAEQAATESGAAIASTYSFAALASAAGSSDRHLSSGTNFPEHAEETSSSSVFMFPKFGPASPPVTTVALRDGVLLDYEVELCARFDRDITSVDDFDAALKGFFLCADFTDRAMLIRMIDPFDFGSGSGFSDAKSAPDFFPTGPFLVIPNDWESFVQQERVTTHLGDELRQDARGSEMILNFRQLVEKALGDATSTRFIYRGDNYRLIEDEKLAEGQAVMSGTPEGVIFMPPSPLQFTRGMFRYVAGGFVSEPNPYDSIIESFVVEEAAADRFLGQDDVVLYTSSSMGQISITVQDVQAGEIVSQAVMSGG